MSFKRPSIELGQSFLRAATWILVFLLGVYRSIFTAWLGNSCRFHPSCSEYAVQALKKYPITQAIKLITHRLLRCRPGGGCGLDPLPISQANMEIL